MSGASVATNSAAISSITGRTPGAACTSTGPIPIRSTHTLRLASSEPTTSMDPGAIPSRRPFSSMPRSDGHQKIPYAIRARARAFGGRRPAGMKEMTTKTSVAGAIAYAIWGLLHVQAAYAVYRVGVALEPGMVQGRVFQDSWNLLFFGGAAIERGVAELLSMTQRRKVQPIRVAVDPFLSTRLVQHRDQARARGVDLVMTCRTKRGVFDPEI